MDVENGGSAERAQSYFYAVEEIWEQYMTYKSFPNHYIYKLFDGHVNNTRILFSCNLVSVA